MLDDLQENEDNVGQLILQQLSSQRREETIVGRCPICGIGELKIITSQASRKRFIGCSQYFVDKSCNATFPIPQKGRLEVLSETCPEDDYPQLRVFGGKRPWVLCLKPDCPLKEAFKAKKESKYKGKKKPKKISGGKL